MIERDGEPSPAFDAMVQSTVDGFLRAYKQVGSPTGFVVPSVLMRGRGVSYWGVLDLKTLPEEDLYIELWRRFHSALYQLGEDQVIGLGIVDMQAVLNRMPSPIS